MLAEAGAAVVPVRSQTRRPETSADSQSKKSRRKQLDHVAAPFERQDKPRAETCSSRSAALGQT